MLKRPHNLVLTFLQLAQYSLIRPTLQEQLSPFYSGLAHYWIGMAWYFHQVIHFVHGSVHRLHSCLVVRETVTIWQG